jgi:hypothetical protein
VSCAALGGCADAGTQLERAGGEPSESTAQPTAAPTPPNEPTQAPPPSQTPEPSDSEQPPQDGGQEDTKALFERVLAAADALLDEGDRPGMTFEDPVTAENCEGMLGLTTQEFTELVVSAYTSNAAFISTAHEVALIECADAAGAERVKGLVAKGFNPNRWICVFPEYALVVESGKYVLLSASMGNFCNAVVEAFASEMGGETGKTDTFYTKPEL